MIANQSDVIDQLAGSQLWIQGATWARSTGASHVGLDTALPATHLISLYVGWGFQEHETVQGQGRRTASENSRPLLMREE